MGLKRADEFRRGALRIALTSRLTRRQVADDLGVGMSTLMRQIRNGPVISAISGRDLGSAFPTRYRLWRYVNG
jgi:transposase